MLELLEQSLLPFNLPLTIALGAVMLFWLVVLMGFLSFDAIDLDVAPELGDADVFSLTALIGKLTNAADIPVTIILSIYTLFLWVSSVLGNYYLNPAQSNLIGLAILGDNTGKQIYPGYPPGHEALPAAWVPWIIAPEQEKSIQIAFGNSFFGQAVFEDPKWDFRKLDFDADVAYAREKAGVVVNSDSPDLRSFRPVASPHSRVCASKPF